MSELHQIGRVANTSSGGAAPDVGEPPAGSEKTAIYITSDQLDDINTSLEALIELNNKILFQLSLITGFDGNE